MEKVDHHASIIIIKSDNNDGRLVLGGYDEGYAKWPGFANFIGGNHENGDDFTPWDILRREFMEETSPKTSEIAQYIPVGEIIKLRKIILENTLPYQDFLITDPYVRGDRDLIPKIPHLRRSIVSCFESSIPSDVVNYIVEILKSGKKFLSEGKSSVTSIDDLVKGNVLLAWTSPVIASHYLKKEIPNPYNAEATPLGSVRPSLKSYLNDFEYVVPVV